VSTERESARGSARWWLLVAALAVMAFVAAIAVQRHVFPFYSGDHDEPVYRYQAEMLLDGDLTIPRSQEEFFRPWLSGPHEDRLVMAYQPGWPAVLAASKQIFGSMLFALGAAAALSVIACFLMARELLGRAGPGALAAALFALSPWMLLLSGTYLNYVFAVGLGTTFGYLLLRGLGTRSRRTFVLGGVIWGGIVLTRPFDAFLYGLPILLYAFLAHRQRLKELVGSAALVALGAIPGLFLTAAFNNAVTGTPFRFAMTVQSGGYTSIGWGVRSSAPDTPPLDFTFPWALDSIRANLWALPGWLLGSWVLVGLAAFGAVRIWRADRARFWLLISMTFAFPLGYVVWWASALSTGGARHGIGPHYYVPIMVPLAILAAKGIVEIRWRRTLTLIALGVLAVALTAYSLPPKLDDKRFVNVAAREYVSDVERGLLARGTHPALVIQERGVDYVMNEHATLSNPPDLRSDVLYALDRGARNADLITEYRDRRVYRIVKELPPNMELTRLPARVKPVAVVSGPAVTLRTTVTNTNGNPVVIAYLCRGSRIHRYVLDTASTAGRSYDVTWTLLPDTTRFEGPYTGITSRLKPMQHGACGKERPDRLTVGASFGSSEQARDPDRSEARYYARVQGGQVQVLTAPENWLRFGRNHAWLPADVAGNLDVRLEAASSESPGT